MATSASSVLGLGSTGVVSVQIASSSSCSSRSAPSEAASLGFATRRRAAACSETTSQLRSEFLPSLSPVKKSIKFAASRKGPFASLNVRAIASDPAQLRSAREDIKTLLREDPCHPILIRLGWHDAGTYDKNIKEWPLRGGANGSIRYDIELSHKANAGLINALKLLESTKQKYPDITYADLFQLASATAIEEAGGPKIPLRYGRKDVSGPDQCVKEGNLPDADPKPTPPADHLRKVFYRMDLNDQDIVALSGAHTLGRVHPERSGFGQKETKYTKNGPGKPGGSSWTPEWLKFDNSYFREIKEKRDADLVVLPTDAVLFEDPEFKKYAEKYATDREAFFNDYAISHAKLSEIGAEFDPPQGFFLDKPEKKDEPEVFVASKYSTQPEAKQELSDNMKDKIRAEYLAIGGSPNKAMGSNYFLNIIIGISVLVLLSYYLGYLG
ncbi:probable L-ascorbate peroxidase 6, chloroplastic/mitochondrial [Physcomitrium patens]|uniref:L-ascorbate peroxidase n=1 Tax=Physcomitrium patens TaxID=3218 RepID=A9U1S4_PHYPA|nr:probable L-ascorbate peroxidase 6, chloroplastic/mitochondrial [Physcomitrium patens]PNR63458.1 hypothetical protein PHYPA_001884 [Physcomitrium patens]|eukprot:XP_024381690.1 probable L-ascorbate peroxidase 6, chloroplastic/mitochondrial [Physcomitrella patens]